MSLSKLVSFEPNGADFKVFHYNGVYMGDISRAHDFQYNFWPELKGGFWPEYLLREICDKLAELNKPINDEMNAYFDALEPENLALADIC